MTNSMIPVEAVEAAKEAMREVTPPPGVSKADWLAEHGSFALIAGAIAAAAPYMLADVRRNEPRETVIRDSSGRVLDRWIETDEDL